MIELGGSLPDRVFAMKMYFKMSEERAFGMRFALVRNRIQFECAEFWQNSSQ